MEANPELSLWTFACIDSVYAWTELITNEFIPLGNVHSSGFVMILSLHVSYIVCAWFCLNLRIWDNFSE